MSCICYRCQSLAVSFSWNSRATPDMTGRGSPKPCLRPEGFWVSAFLLKVAPAPHWWTHGECSPLSQALTFPSVLLILTFRSGYTWV